MASGDLDEKLAEARRVLKQIPGVFGVGYGYKERAGQTTGELCFRVYVRQKKPLSTLSAQEVVPKELFGIPTDVLLVIDSKKLGCADTEAHSPLVGGIGISNLKRFLAATGSGPGDLGTLGFFATIDGSTSRDRYALLTNNHVLVAGGGAAGDKVYQPPLVGGTGVSMDNLHPIGEILNLGLEANRSFTYPGGTAEDYYVDAASAKIDTCYSSWCDSNCGISLANEIKGLNIGGSSAIEGIARVSNSDLPSNGSYPVVKVGRTSGRTVGRITDCSAPLSVGSPSISADNCIVIEHTGPSCESGTMFSVEGDSGSVVVNDDRKIVGLLFGAGSAGSGTACHIHPVVATLGITMVSTSNPITASPGASGTLFDEAVGIDADLTDVTRAAALRQEILCSERGRMYRTLVDEHREEVMYLVNRVRPVAVAWHRLNGPDFLAHVIHAARHSHHSVPHELHGLRRNDAFRRLLEVLSTHGSGALRADIARHHDEVCGLFDEANDIEALAERLREPRASARARVSG